MTYVPLLSHAVVIFGHVSFGKHCSQSVYYLLLSEDLLDNNNNNNILIPGKHELTALIMRQGHHAVLHNGLKETLAQVRTKYWIIRGRQIVK